MKRLLIAGFGDIARRAAPALKRHYAIAALARQNGFDLDRPETLVPGSCDALLHCAPPPTHGERDLRTANLLAALERAGSPPARVVYISTSGVYGDCAGARVDESRVLDPQTARARRRADAERRLMDWCAERSIALIVLRAPGIYARDRLPLERLRAGTPALRPEEDVYTNHIHADDLAGVVSRSLEDDAPAGVYNASDNSELRMGEWLDLVADTCALARPPRLSRREIEERVPAQLLSFMRESRRLDNRRLKQTLGYRLRYPTVREGLCHEHAARIY